MGYFLTLVNNKKNYNILPNFCYQVKQKKFIFWAQKMYIEAKQKLMRTPLDHQMIRFQMPHNVCDI